jgi:LmbE family N-acetylglucosaminyl deacetylase
LGLATDEDQASTLCGGSFARYAAAGTEVTLVCAAAHDWTVNDRPTIARHLGAGNLVLLDFQLNELTAAGLEDLFADVIRSVRPHVVVADGSNIAVRDAATTAFSAVRLGGGSAALPAKLYFRPAGGPSGVAVTTAIAVPTAAAPELFTRAFPNPWVTGVVERDLFAGLLADPAIAATLADRLAS